MTNSGLFYRYIDVDNGTSTMTPEIFQDPHVIILSNDDFEKMVMKIQVKKKPAVLNNTS
jgi:hypothetical protein